jgi:hypothetical protein
MGYLGRKFGGMEAILLFVVSAKIRIFSILGIFYLCQIKSNNLKVELPEADTLLSF